MNSWCLCRRSGWMVSGSPSDAQQCPAFGFTSVRKSRPFRIVCFNLKKNLQGMQIWLATLRNQHRSSFSGKWTFTYSFIFCLEIMARWSKWCLETDDFHLSWSWLVSRKLTHDLLWMLLLMEEDSVICFQYQWGVKKQTQRCKKPF